MLVVHDNEILLKKEHLENNLTIESLIEMGFIEYVDANEEDNYMVAIEPSYLDRKGLYSSLMMKVQYTHCEIHPSVMFGVVASFTPLVDHNQATKNTLQCSMAKQAIGAPNMNFNLEFPTIAHQLFYPQRPLVNTKASKYLTTN